MKKHLLIASIALLALLAVTARAEERPLRIVASFSILGDMIKQIGGEAVDVYVLAGPNADMHAYQPTTNDIKILSKADVIAINGLGFDTKMKGMAEASRARAKLLVASAGVKPIFVGEGDSAVPDPHAWQNPLNGRIYVRNIAGALIGAAPEQGAKIRERAAAYDAELKKTDAWIKEKLKNIPPEKRIIITTHDAFRYFGKAYDIKFLAPLGVNEEAEPTSSGIAGLIKQIRDEGVRKVFIENMNDPRLMKQIAKDGGAQMGGTLYSDALSEPDGPAPTYLDIFRHNVPLMRDAME